MPIPTWAAFEKATNNEKRFERARGPNIAKVDSALKKWDRESKLATPIRKAELLAAILSACAKWLKLKMDVSADDLRLTRKTWIFNLAEAALDELQLLATKTKADMDFDRRKFQVLGGVRKVLPAQVGQNPFASLRELSQGYTHERTLYVKDKKTVAISGTSMHGYMNWAKEGMAPFDTLSFADKKFIHLTEKEFQKLALLAQGANMNHEVEYLKKQDRTAYWIKPGAEGKFYDIHDKVVKAPASGGWIWAMDEYGNLFIRSGVEADGAPIRLNHSTFNAGKPVICAGSIVIEEGELRKLDNSSGHYKPVRGDLAIALQCLQDDGADISKAAAWVFEYPNDVMVTHKYLSAQAFLRNPDGRADVVS